MADHILISIRSEHSNSIYEGIKKAELRKSFSSTGSSIVFLYEVAPVAAVTGFIVTSETVHGSVDECVARATELGVPRERSVAYYGKRQKGWVLEIAFAKRFSAPVSLKELQQINHYFRVPQTFGYLNKYDALTQKLISSLHEALRRAFRVKKVRSKNDLFPFRQMIMETVGESYQDIDDDFLQQNLDAPQQEDASFSTSEKRVLAIMADSFVIGYAVVTVKKTKCFKTGPTVLVKAFRGMGVGTLIRQEVEKYANKLGAIKLYCTCPINRPSIISYLLNSGMQLEAVLNKHLSTLRDELVFGKLLHAPIVRTNPTTKLKLTEAETISISQFCSNEKQEEQLTSFLLKYSSVCYFALNASDVTSILEGASNYERGELKYSNKPRRIYIARNRGRTMLGAAVLTLKRSGMVKINLFLRGDDHTTADKLIEFVLKNVDTRRFYLSLPVTFSSTALACVCRGFIFEGVLRVPFGAGDHFCLGTTNHNPEVSMKHL